MFYPYPISFLQFALFWPVVAVGGLALVRAFAGSSGDEKAAKRSGLSTLGIALQAIGFGVTGFGPIHFALPWSAPSSLICSTLVALLGGSAIAVFIAATRAMGKNWSVVARDSVGPPVGAKRPLRGGAPPNLFGALPLFTELRDCVWPFWPAACRRAILSRRGDHPYPHRGEVASGSVRRQARALRAQGACLHSLHRLNSISKPRRRSCPWKHRHGPDPCDLRPRRHRHGPRQLHPSTAGRTWCPAICLRGSTATRARPSFGRSP